MYGLVIHVCEISDVQVDTVGTFILNPPLIAWVFYKHTLTYTKSDGSTCSETVVEFVSNQPPASGI